MTDRMKERMTPVYRVWAGAVLMLAVTLGASAQGSVTLALVDEPLTDALRLVEEQGGKSIIFSVSETERYRVNAEMQGVRAEKDSVAAESPEPRAVETDRKGAVAEVVPSVNIVGVSRNKKSLALGALGNVVREKAYGVQIAGLSNHVGDMGGGVTIAGLSNTSGGSYYGVQISGLWNMASEDAKGVMVCGLCNMTGEGFDGIQIGGLSNRTKGMQGIQIGGLGNVSRDMMGIQVAGLGNVSRKVYGLQLAGLMNVSHDVYGLQFAGLMNVSHDVYGFQFAGLVNVAKRVRGVQFASILNVAEDSDFPIGLVNIVKNGDKGVALTRDMLGNTVVSFRSGGRYSYGILGVGCNLRGDMYRVVAEAGYGIQIPVCRWLDVNNELKTAALGFSGNNAPRNFGYLLAPSVTLWEHCNLFAGPSINFWMSDAAFAESLNLNKGLWRKENGRGIVQCLYVGYQVGVQYVF